MTWATFGHERVKEILFRQLGAGRLPHAYLFVGPAGVGKKMLAEELAKHLLGAENLSNHPDFLSLDFDGEIVMEQALGFIERLSLKPFVAQTKVAIINNAENLNAASSNALLKTLEEPSGDTVIILVASSARLLPTIVSRCEIFHFSGFNRLQLQEFANRQGLKASDEILGLSFGRPARLKKLAEDKDFFREQQESITRYKKLSAGKLGDRLASIGELAEAETTFLRARFMDWLLWQTQELNDHPSEFPKARLLLSALHSLERNQNKKLVLQTLIQKI